MKRTWTPEQIELLKIKYPDSNPNELCLLFPDKSYKAIRTKAKILRLKKTVQKFRFSLQQIAELKRDYSNTLNKDLADRFGCSIHTLHNKAHSLKLNKDKEFIREVARNNFTDDHPAKKYWIKKGNCPPNKGKKMETFMSEETMRKFKANQFKKDHIPHNATSVGFERINEDGYILIKVPGKRKLVLKHRYVWEQSFGLIPKGYNIQFKDGNRKNCHIANLYIISRSEQMKNENSLHTKYPKEVQQLFQLKGALKRQINKTEKQQ